MSSAAKWKSSPLVALIKSLDSYLHLSKMGRGQDSQRLCLEAQATTYTLFVPSSPQKEKFRIHSEFLFLQSWIRLCLEAQATTYTLFVSLSPQKEKFRIFAFTVMDQNCSLKCHLGQSVSRHVIVIGKYLGLVFIMKSFCCRNLPMEIP